MITFIDISNHQKGMDLSKVLPSLGGAVMKATEGTGFVDAYCDPWVQTCIKAGKPWGFYHFGRNNGATAEADYFIKNTLNYFGEGIPVLDWEDGQSVAWVNEFVRRVHDVTQVWPWIYANPWRFNQGGVEPNCMRWSAQYPGITTFDDAKAATPDKCDQFIGAWQFTSSGRISGWSGNLDLDLFYGDETAWEAYARGDRAVTETPSTPSIPEEENAVYRLYNPNDGDHFLTADYGEAVTCVASGWVYEGVAFYAAKV